MDVTLISEAGITERSPDELPALLAGEGVVWVDVPEWSDEVRARLAEVFGLHHLALQDCAVRNQVPKVHVYGDHVFIVLHAPKLGAGGHVHYIELDQFVSRDYVITVHGPLNEAVPLEDALVEVRALRNRIAAGRFRPATGYELSHALVSALTGRLREHTAQLTREVWRLEQAVTGNKYSDPEQFLDEMFRARHGLLTVKTMCTLSAEVYGRMAKVRVFGDSGERLVKDLVDQFHRLGVMADGQKDYLQGTIEFYQARTNTKMTIAAERLAVIAAVTLPITALSSVFGMNVIVNESTHWDALWLLLGVMSVMSLGLLWWTKRKGWW
ncbi:magnesium transporter CorA family protein [Microbacterium sp.]|uniref:magnesium transporter CorA family protein n=1 Tax=Microbacterium sp. TaxID=51671 RepID=UPI0039E3E9AC